MNSQSKDPSIGAADAAATTIDDDATARELPAEGALAVDTPMGSDNVPRPVAGPAGPARRLRAIEGAAGQAASGKAAGDQSGWGTGRPGPGGQGQRSFEPDGFAPDSQPGEPIRRTPTPARPSQPTAAEPARAAAAAAQIRPRHRGIMALAFLLIVVPAIGTAVYMWGFAVDQYVSTAGFAIRNQSAMSSPFDFLGAFGGGSSSTAKDTDILHNFVGSQQLVEEMDRQIGIQAIYSKPKNDPYFAYNTSGTIEDLVNYWGKMVQVNYDNTTGLMQLNVYAFTPDDAQKVAKAVLDQGSLLVNKLAAVARDDTTRYAKQALDDSEKRLKDARAAMNRFRIENNILDPAMDASAMSKVYGALTQELVQAQVELEMLKQGSLNASDPRIAAVQQRIDIIQNRIDEEQTKVGQQAGSSAPGYADIISNYQRLNADLEFGEKAYLASLASYDSAEEDAQHKQVYLAVYEEPTMAQASIAPRRWLALISVVVLGFLSWSIITLIYYALRDRR